MRLPWSVSFQAFTSGNASRGERIVAKNEGIGVPFSPVLNVRYTSAGESPNLKFPVVKSRGRIGTSQSSNSAPADGPSPLPALPWQAQHCRTRYTSLPSRMSAAGTLWAEGKGGVGISIDADTFSV